MSYSHNKDYKQYEEKDSGALSEIYPATMNRKVIKGDCADADKNKNTNAAKKYLHDVSFLQSE